MSATQDNPARGADAGPDTGPPDADTNDQPHPDHCENAREYVLQRLGPTEPKSPSELADEYECSNIHMQKTLAELHDSGMVDRVSRGNYVVDNVDDALDGAADTVTGAVDQLGDADGDADAPAPVLPMDPKTLGLLLGAALVLWLAFRAASNDSDTELNDSLNAPDDPEQGELGGGLTG